MTPAILGVEVMEMELRYFVHDADILRLTAKHNVNHDEIYNLGGLAGDLADIQRRALIDRDRGTMVEYWRVFLHDMAAVQTYDVDGIFRPEFDLQY